jgi:hypothetical protein
MSTRKPKYTPIEIVNHFYRLAEDYVIAPQVVIVIAADTVQCAYRSNLVGGNEALIRSLRQLADNLENEDFQSPETRTCLAAHQR